MAQEMPAPSITTTRKGRFTLFGLMYFVQGTLLAYVLVFNNLYLRASGALASQLALINGLLVLPFILKIGIGLISDKFSLLGRGHRVPYIVIGLLMTSLGVVGAAMIPPVEQFPLFLVVALFIAFGLALYDTVTDGLAIDVTPESELSLVQGSMVIGRAIGLVLLAAAYGRAIDLIGWRAVFWTVALFSLLPLPLLRQVHEAAEREPAQRFEWAAARRLWRPQIARLGTYAVVYAFAVYGANAIVTLFAREELGASLVQVGDAAAIGGLGMLLGGLLVTGLSPRLDLWRQGLWTMSFVSIALLGVAWLAQLHNIVLVTLLWGVCLAAAELVYVTIAMFHADPQMGAGTFALFMAISNVGTGLGQATTTGLIDTISFRWIFAALALVNLLTLPLLAAMRRGARREQPLSRRPPLPLDDRLPSTSSSD